MKDQTRLDELNRLLEQAPGDTAAEKLRWAAGTMGVQVSTIYAWRSPTGVNVGRRSLDFLRRAVACRSSAG
jgi:hypothetical protein